MNINGMGIREFELEIKLKDGGEQEYDYKKTDGHAKATVVKCDKDGNRTMLEAAQAIQSSEQLLAELSPSKEMSQMELIRKTYSALKLSDESVAHLKIEVEFADGSEIEVKT